MALSEPLREAVCLIEKAKGILDNHLSAKIMANDPVDVRHEMLRRIQAVDHLSEAGLWVRRLDPDFSRDSEGQSHNKVSTHQPT